MTESVAADAASDVAVAVGTGEPAGPGVPRPTIVTCGRQQQPRTHSPPPDSAGAGRQPLARRDKRLRRQRLMVSPVSRVEWTVMRRPGRGSDPGSGGTGTGLETRTVVAAAGDDVAGVAAAAARQRLPWRGRSGGAGGVGGGRIKD